MAAPVYHGDLYAFDHIKADRDDEKSIWVAYLLSYLFRTVNAVVSPELTRDFALGPGTLGLLTSAYFVTFAAVQLPAGVLLDRYGPRRVQAVLLAMAAAAEAGKDASKAMIAQFGRAKTLGEACLGFPDAGACSVVIMLSTMRDYATV